MKILEADIDGNFEINSDDQGSEFIPIVVDERVFALIVGDEEA